MKKLILLPMLLICTSLFADSNSASITNTVTSSGIGIGSAIAVSISWSNNRSILWAIIHGFFSWLYVIYYAITRKD